MTRVHSPTLTISLANGVKTPDSNKGSKDNGSHHAREGFLFCFFWMLENLFACAPVRPGSTASFKQPHVLLINAPICFNVEKRRAQRQRLSDCVRRCVKVSRTSPAWARWRLSLSETRLTSVILGSFMFYATGHNASKTRKRDSLFHSLGTPSPPRVRASRLQVQM